MSKSIQEEILSALWALASLLAFGFDFPTWGVIFSIKAALDMGCAFKAAIEEIREEA